MLYNLKEIDKIWWPGILVMIICSIGLILLLFYIITNGATLFEYINFVVTSLFLLWFYIALKHSIDNQISKNATI